MNLRPYFCSTSRARSLRAALGCLLLLLLPMQLYSAHAAHPAAPPSDPAGTWAVDANGFHGTLTIDALDGTGNFTGTILNGDPIEGLYDADTQDITFMRLMPGWDTALDGHSLVTTFQAYVGHIYGGYRMRGHFYVFASEAADGLSLQTYNFSASFRN